MPFEYARTLYEWGVRTRNPEIAVERLDRALVAFERLGVPIETPLPIRAWHSRFGFEQAYLCARERQRNLYLSHSTRE